MNPTFDLHGVTALVTGASSGLGRHMAGVLARAGARIAITARRGELLGTLAAEIAQKGGAALPIAADLTDMAAIETVLAQTEAKLGKVTLLINNAGIAKTRAFLDQPEEEWRSVLDLNLTAAWRVARATAQRMKDNGDGGAIVNIASILGLRPAKQVAAYSAGKAALISLTQSMALELAPHRIRVNALAPGYIATDLNRDFLNGGAGQSLLRRVPLQRFGEAADLDGALLLLASDAGRYMTGSVLVVDGGHSLSFL